MGAGVIEEKKKEEKCFLIHQTKKPQLNIIEPGFWGRTPSRLYNQ